MVILFSNGNSEDSRLAIMKKIEDIQEDQIHILPLSVSARETNCIVDPMCPDSKFLNKIKDDDLRNYLDSTKGNITTLLVVLTEIQLTKLLKWYRNFFPICIAKTYLAIILVQGLMQFLFNTFGSKLAYTKTDNRGVPIDVA